MDGAVGEFEPNVKLIALTTLPAALLAMPGVAGTSRADEAEEFFEKRIRPVLVEHCHQCHSADAEKIKGGLRLDSRAAILKGGDTGAAVAPGEPEKSLLITAVSYADKDLKMPPPKNGVDRKLSSAQIADLAEWVRMGARVPENAQRPTNSHWAFQPIANPPVPAVKDKAWPKTDIDAFILAKLEAANLTPAPPADPRTLLRRMTYDLTGLPPTPKEVEAFTAESIRSGQAAARPE